MSTSPRDPWTTLPPAYGPHLPGAIVPLTVLTRGALYQVPWRSVRHLHAAITHTFDRRHHTTKPDFALIPTQLSPSGWALWLKDLPVAQAVAGGSADAMLRDAPVTIRCGAVTKLRTPAVEGVGRQRVVLAAETPVVIRHANAGATDHGDAKQVYLYPVEHALVSTLTNALAERLGLKLAPADLALKILATETRTERVVIGHLNGHGVVRGWTGRVAMDVSPLGRWLLDCAARIGLGGRTAFGFGRVKVGSMALDLPPLGEPYPAGGRPEDRVSAQAEHAWTKLTGEPRERAVAGVEAMLAGARFDRIADNEIWVWRNGAVLLFVERSALGAQRVCALGATAGSDEERRLGAGRDAPPLGEDVGRFALTTKAIERYRERIEPHLSFEQAGERLRALTDAGRRVGPYRGEHLGKLPGAELWRGPRVGTGNARTALANSRIRFVVATGEGGRPTVVTVLPHRHEARWCGGDLDAGARMATVAR